MATSSEGGEIANDTLRWCRGHLLLTTFTLTPQRTSTLTTATTLNTQPPGSGYTAHTRQKRILSSNPSRSFFTSTTSSHHERFELEIEGVRGTMTHLLPPSLLRLFAARPPLEYAAPLQSDADPNRVPLPKERSLISKRKSVRSPLTGVASTLERIKQDAADRGEITEDVEPSFTHTRVTLSELDTEARKAEKAETKRRGLEEYKPAENSNATSDAYKTLFLARLAYDVTEKDLHREFDMYGPIERIVLVRDRQGKSRGYAFVAYERERDMRAAYKDAEGIKINGRRVMVDVERGRTVKDWKPTRLGGGLGGSSRKPKKAPEPIEQPQPIGGGFRGARGGFRGGRGGFNQRPPYATPRYPQQAPPHAAPQSARFDNGYNRPYHSPSQSQRFPQRDRDYPSSYSSRPAYDDPPPPAKRSRY